VLLLDCLCIDMIRRRLDTELVGFQLYLYQEVDSTHTTLGRLAEAGAREGTVVPADAQRAGRSRRGSAWFSPPGVNLYAAVLFRPRISLAEIPVFSFISSLALTDAIRAEGVAAAIKWPNDVLVGGRKVGCSVGAFTAIGDIVHWVILGVAVNLNVERSVLTQGLGPSAAGATSVSEVAGRMIDRNAFTAGYLNALQKWLDVYRMAGPTDVLRAWRERDVLAGRVVEVRGTAAPYRGRVLGANSEGQLLVEDARAVPHRVTTAEVVLLEEEELP
jgi:BirA family biotin operon repressor/biotin-[acetyl-CoA-carboxylase] ligase